MKVRFSLQNLCETYLLKVLNIRVRALKPLVFLVNISNILNINTLHSSDINTIYIKYIYIKYIYIKYIVAILLYNEVYNYNIIIYE